MIFTDIRVQNYRSYKDASFELGGGVNIVVGPNAIGKTNLLEALMLSSTGKAYRSKDNAIIRHGEPWARVDTHTTDNQTRVTKIKKDGETITREYDIDDKIYKRFPSAQRQPVVLFEPTNLSLLSGEPSARREYVDDIVEKYEPEHGRLLHQYRRIVAQRNALLKQGPSSSDQIFAWNLKLCETAVKIVENRQILLNTINTKLSETYSTIANQKQRIKLHYSTKQDLQNYSSSLMKQLESNLDIDLARGFTGNGPHRDDIGVYFGNNLAVDQASRGEVRTLLLTLKILELEILEEKTNTRPLLLLDDVFSELDGARRRSLTEYLHKYQTLITTTDADVVVQHFTENTTVIPLVE